MNCEEMKSKISNWMDKELSKEEAQLLESHLSSCDLCSQYSSELLQSRKLFVESDLINPSSDFVSNLWERLGSEEAKLFQSPLYYWKRWLWPAAAAASVAFASYWIFFSKISLTTPVYASGTLICHISARDALEGSCCVAPIESQIRNIPEIESIRADISNNQVIIVTKPGKQVRLDQIKKSLKKCGGGTYSVEEIRVIPTSKDIFNR